MPEIISFEAIPAEAHALIRRLREREQTAVLAESCTAGLAADLLARVPGASKILWGSFVCYTAQAKIAMLDLDTSRLERYGMVSGETARDMAQAALAKSGAFVAGAVTGLAGPDGDGSGLPVGTVWIATALRGAAPRAALFNFSGYRNEIRLQAAHTLIKELLDALDRNDGN